MDKKLGATDSRYGPSKQRNSAPAGNLTPTSKSPSTYPKNQCINSDTKL
jgi:hypothetical protein